jgi:hypothetical protein
MGKSRSPEWQYRVSTCQRPEEREPAAFSNPNNCKPALPIGTTGTWCIGRDVSSWHFSDVAGLTDYVSSWVAGSTGRRNTGVESLCWSFKLQGLTWSFV